MKKFLLLIALGLLLTVLATPVYSSDHKEKHNYNGHFGDMDLDGDDLVNWEEFKKFFSHAGKDVFKKADGNNDDSIDHDEWHEFKDAKGYKHIE